VGERRRYLKQLRELGETELVLPEAAPTGAASGAPGAPSRRPEGRPRPEAGAEAPPALAAPAGKSQRTEPAMYGPGLVVDAAAPRDDLFTADPVAQAETLEAIAQLAAACRKCALGHTRSHSVPGEGNPHAQLVCVGEAPGQTEDETGRPFVGRAGHLLDQILHAIALAREDVFICNVLKCRPPNNRTPEPLESRACSPYLHRQLELIRPKVILALGKPAATTLLNVPASTSLGELRGKVHRYRGIPLVVTYHPAALLRNPHWKAPTWDDVRIARRILDGTAAG